MRSTAPSRGSPSVSARRGRGARRSALAATSPSTSRRLLEVRALSLRCRTPLPPFAYSALTCVCMCSAVCVCSHRVQGVARPAQSQSGGGEGGSAQLIPPPTASVVAVQQPRAAADACVSRRRRRRVPSLKRVEGQARSVSVVAVVRRGCYRRTCCVTRRSEHRPADGVATVTPAPALPHGRCAVTVTVVVVAARQWSWRRDAASGTGVCPRRRRAVLPADVPRDRPAVAAGVSRRGRTVAACCGTPQP
jgi:hypothetical protein